jgi:type IV pilus assembly protein PilN
MIRINLLKPGQKEIREAPSAAPVMEFKEKRQQPLFALILVGAVIAIAALFFIQRGEINKEQDLLAKAQEEKRSLQYVVAKLEELQQQREVLKRKIDLIIRLQAEQPSAVLIMDDLSKMLPDWVWLTDASYDSGIITIKGRTMNNTLLSDYIGNLMQSPYLNNVSLISSVIRRQRNDTFYEFSMSAQFIPPAVAESESTPAAEGEKQ